MPSGYVSGPNPVALLNRKAKYESDQFMGNVYVDIELLRNLKFHSDFTLLLIIMTIVIFRPVICRKFG